VAKALSTVIPRIPWSTIVLTCAEMSTSGWSTKAPAAVTTRTLPAFSATNMRPSGAQLTAVGKSRPDTSVRSSKPAGTVAAGDAPAIDRPNPSAETSNAPVLASDFSNPRFRLPVPFLPTAPPYLRSGRPASARAHGGTIPMPLYPLTGD
jgi:hypothetical protein